MTSKDKNTIQENSITKKQLDYLMTKPLKKGITQTLMQWFFNMQHNLQFILIKNYTFEEFFQVAVDQYTEEEVHAFL